MNSPISLLQMLVFHWWCRLFLFNARCLLSWVRRYLLKKFYQVQNTDFSSLVSVTYKQDIVRCMVQKLLPGQFFPNSPKKFPREKLLDPNFFFIISGGVYVLKVNNENTRAMFEIFSKLTIKTLELRQWRRSFYCLYSSFWTISHLLFTSVSIVDVEQVNASWDGTVPLKILRKPL